MRAAAQLPTDVEVLPAAMAALSRSRWGRAWENLAVMRCRLSVFLFIYALKRDAEALGG